MATLSRSQLDLIVSGLARRQAKAGITKASVPMASQAVVLDNGSGMIKAGFAGDDNPRCSVSSVRRSFDKATVSAWAERVAKALRIQWPEHPVLFAEPTGVTRADREAITRLMFEMLEVPRFYTIRGSVLALYAHRQTTGIVLDAGDGVSHVVPIVDGFALTQAIVSKRDPGEAFVEALGACPDPKRKALVANVLIGGDAARRANLQTAIAKSLEALASDSMTLEAVSPVDPVEMVFPGGKFLAGVTAFQERWITKAEYERSGPDIVHRKAF